MSNNPSNDESQRADSPRPTATQDNVPTILASPPPNSLYFVTPKCASSWDHGNGKPSPQGIFTRPIASGAFAPGNRTDWPLSVHCSVQAENPDSGLRARPQLDHSPASQIRWSRLPNEADSALRPPLVSLRVLDDDRDLEAQVPARPVQTRRKSNTKKKNPSTHRNGAWLRKHKDTTNRAKSRRTGTVPANRARVKMLTCIASGGGLLILTILCTTKQRGNLSPH